MQQHTKVYYDHFKLTKSDFVECEVCGSMAVDIHHINPRSSFGSKTKGTKEGMQDHIGNLIALCRGCHEEAHNGTLNRNYLQDEHNAVLAKQKGQTI